MENTDKSERVRPVFARHETFHPRFGWLKKGFDKVCSNGKVFTDKDASAVLGVGKNMVKAIKYWCYAFKIIEESESEGRKAIFVATNPARKLLSDDGLDPYLEDPASLWLLHWWLLKTPCDAPMWYFAFNEFNQVEFTNNELVDAGKDFKEKLFPDKRLSDQSLAKDANCLLRMYVERNSVRQLKEDSLDSPFTQLQLISSFEDSKRFAFNFGSKPGLAPEIIVYSCLDYCGSVASEARTISISRLLYEPGSPGQVFKLSESKLSEAIENVSKSFDDVRITDTAGMVQFAFKSDPGQLADRILTSYYS